MFFFEIIIYINIFFTVLIKEVYVRFLQKRDADGFFSAETIHENSITDMFWV